MKHFKLLFAVAALLTITASTAIAQTSGTWLIKGGYNHLFPQVKSGDITGVPNGKVDVSDGGSLFGSIAYMITDNVATELTLGVPPKHDITGDGSIAAAGKIANAKIVPPMLSLQHRFN